MAGAGIVAMTDGVRHSVLISGASFAGLSAAWWMHRLGYRVTVVELAAELRRGGTPVDIREGVIEAVRRMGLLERIAERSLPKRPMEFLDGEGRTIAGGMPGDEGVEEYEIERGVLLEMLFDEVKGDAEVLFGESIAELEQTADEVMVTLRGGARRRFSLVLGCDGTHSATRRMCFGEEAGYLKFLEAYFSLTIVDKLLVPENTGQLFNLPGRTVMLNGYNGKTDIGFAFATNQQISYDRRDYMEQRRMIREQFAGEGWRIGELLEEMDGCEDFYFDKLCQIRMDAWSKGRVVLVGDAAYCPSPAAGMGGSVAILGAAALADAMVRHPGDFAAAFAEYDASFRPVVEAIQAEAVEVGLPMFLPRTEAAIGERNRWLRGE